MRFLNLNSINKKLTLLVMFSVLPALVILLYSGIEQRRQSIENAKQDLFLLIHTMADAQREITRSTRQILSTISLLPSIQAKDIHESSEVFKAILEQNPTYNNIALIDLTGEVLASGLAFSRINLADRKHVREALERKNFAVGEHIASRIGPPDPVIPFAYPVLDKKGVPKAILTTTIKLTNFYRFHDISDLPEKSFVSETDHQGIRLFYYPPQEATNPVGKTIKAKSFEIASQAKEPGIFIGTGSDGLRRIFAFEQVRLTPEDDPYIYVWSGIPEAHILAPANAALTRNLLFMLLASVMALFISWVIGKKMLVSPIQNLVNLTRKISDGNLEVRSNSIANSDEFGALANAFHDMADRLAINQRTLRESEERLKTLFEYAPEAYFLCGAEGIFIDCNKKAEDLIGCKREGLIGKNFFELGMLSMKELQKATELFSKNKNGEPNDPNEFTLKRMDDLQVVVEISTHPIHIGDIDVVLWIARDITERKQTAEVLRENEKKLARSKKMESLGLLASGVAHDLNNVLSGIVSYPELILMDLPEESKFRKPIETIKDSGYRAADIVQDLLTVARGVAITREPLNLNDLIDEYLYSPEFIKLQQFSPSVMVKTLLDKDLFNISGSQFHIRKAVMNLVLNAAEAIEGSGKVTILTMNRYMDKPLRGYDNITTGEYVVLSVSDDGSGISSTDLERIFEPFYTKKVMGRSGTGLGLAVVWNTMLDHKGYIDVIRSEIGTTFELFFPITREELSSKDLSISINDYKGNGKWILVVDDVESQRDISCRMLERLGYQTKAVASGEDAIAYLKENVVDLILLDMIMDPGINGRETYERIIEIHPKQKAIIVSGFAVTDDVKAAHKLGAGAYIKKPYSIENIGIAIKKELDK